MSTTPSQRGTQHRKLRLDDELWAELGDLAEQTGTDRSAVLRQWAEYAVRRPGSRMPARLDRTAGAATAATPATARET